MEFKDQVKMWRLELERQTAGMGIMMVFDSMLVAFGEQHREIEHRKDENRGQLIDNKQLLIENNFLKKENERLKESLEQSKSANKRIKEETKYIDYRRLLDRFNRQKVTLERYEKALEEIAYKGFNVEPKRVVVKIQSNAREALGNKR